MNELERKIFRLEDDIRIAYLHLDHMMNPCKYCLPQTAEQRQADIKLQQIRISQKTLELEKLKKQTVTL